MNPESPQPPSLPVVRLLPLVENSPNEGLANLLARLLIDDEAQAEQGAQGALLILTGIQSFFDNGGDYQTVELLWEPVIVARHMEKTLGLAAAAAKAADMAAAARGVNDERGAAIYERTAQLLAGQVNKPVDNKT